MHAQVVASLQAPLPVQSKVGLQLDTTQETPLQRSCPPAQLAV